MLNTNPCPICHDTTVVVMHHEGSNKAWPECWKCGYRGNDKYKGHMIIEDVKEEFLGQEISKRQELMDFARDLWNEVIGMERLESDPTYFGEDDDDGGDDEEAFDPWYDIATDELLLEEEADNSKK